MKNSYFLIQKILYFISISVIFKFLWISKDIVENQDLYIIRKTTFEKIETKNSCFLI